MIRYRRPAVFAVVCAAALACGVPFAAVAGGHSAMQGAAGRPLALTLFRGDLGANSNLALGSWGSGYAEVSKDRPFSGDSSIKATTNGMYQGARIDFKESVDLNDALRNKNAYMRFQLRFTGDGSTQANFDPNNLTTTSGLASPFKKMRFLLVMADGSRYELVRPVEVPPSDDPSGYIPLAFPIAALTKKMDATKMPTGDGAKLKQIAIFGDRYQQFYIGEIGVITDETDLTVSPLEDQIFFANQTTAFVANAEGGASTLRYSWDFDASDGIQEDATGRSVTYVFPKSGQNQKTYKVTLTVSDVDGLKKPVSTTLEANVAD